MLSVSWRSHQNEFFRYFYGTACLFSGILLFVYRFKLVDEVVKLNTPDALRMALQQHVVSTETRLSQSDGDSLLHYTSRKGSTECLRYLLFEAYSQFPYELTNDKGYNVLHSAVHGGKLENIELILSFLLKSEDETSEDTTLNTETFLNAKTTLGKS